MGRRVVHLGSGLKGTVTKVDGAYSWVLGDDGSEFYIYTTELSDAIRS